MPAGSEPGVAQEVAVFPVRVAYLTAFCRLIRALYFRRAMARAVFNVCPFLFGWVIDGSSVCQLSVYRLISTTVLKAL